MYASAWKWLGRLEPKHLQRSPSLFAGFGGPQSERGEAQAQVLLADGVKVGKVKLHHDVPNPSFGFSRPHHW